MLEFNDNGKFRIMLIGDIHEKYDYEGRGLDKYLDYRALADTAINTLRPDLCIFMGDIAYAEDDNELRTVIENAMEPCVEAGVPYAVIYGNHDGERGAALTSHDRIYRTMPFCLYRKGDCTNDSLDYNLRILASDGDRTAYNLWFINTGSRAESGGYACASKEQNEWFTENENRLNREFAPEGKKIPSMVFQHIPVIEEYRLTKRVPLWRLTIDGVTFLGDVSRGVYVADRKTGVTGYLGEAPCTSDDNYGQFGAWKNGGCVKAAFFGHDHMNDIVGQVDGITLGQCRLTGFRPYGDGMRQGVRIIDLYENEPDHFDTRMYYYRQLVGRHCRSIHGRVKWFPDRINVKIDVLEKYVLPAAAAAGAAGFAVKKLRKRR